LLLQIGYSGRISTAARAIPPSEATVDINMGTVFTGTGSGWTCAVGNLPADLDQAARGVAGNNSLEAQTQEVYRKLNADTSASIDEFNSQLDLETSTQLALAQDQGQIHGDTEAYFNRLADNIQNAQQLRILGRDLALDVGAGVTASNQHDLAALGATQFEFPAQEPSVDISRVTSNTDSALTPNEVILSNLRNAELHGGLAYTVIQQQLADAAHELEYGVTRPDDPLPGQPRQAFKAIDTAAEARLHQAQQSIGVIAGGPGSENRRSIDHQFDSRQ
jgi:hypothetical protein